MWAGWRRHAECLRLLELHSLLKKPPAWKLSGICVFGSQKVEGVDFTNNGIADTLRGQVPTTLPPSLPPFCCIWTRCHVTVLFLLFCLV